MFDIGWSELLVIGIVALIAIGPKELPTVLRTAGHWMGKLRRMASEFQGQFQEALREAEIADLKKQFDDASNAATGALDSVTKYDPLENTRKDIESAFEDKPKLPADAAPSASADNGPVAAAAAGPVAPPDASAAVPTAGFGLPAPETPPPVTAQDIAPAPADPVLAGEAKPKNTEGAA
jgi:sec-independent protein translocase protein TatB